jgi:hypothetical protein
MVSAGIYFSGVQFHVALRTLRSAPIAPVTREEVAVTGGSGAREPAGIEPASKAPTATLQTSLEAGAEGIKISSPVLGVIILVISFLFFYLYLVHIYPISEIQ